MSDPLRHVADPQTAFTPVAGELCAKALFRPEQIIPNPARPTATDHRSSLVTMSLALVVVSLPHNPRAEDDSIPIE
jgi:hypothetical protein